MAIITRDKVKALLGLTGTSDKDDQIDALIPIVQNQVVDEINNRFHTDIYISATTIAFNDASPATITDSDSGFIDAGFPASNIDIDVQGGLSDYLVHGVQLTPTDDLRNTGIYGVATVEAGTMTLNTGEELIAEAAGNGSIIYLVRFPKGIQTVVADMISFKMNDKRLLGSFSLADYSETAAAGGAGGYPKALLSQLNPWRKLKWD